MLALSDNRITKQGVIIIKGQQHRTQEKNRDDVLQRLAALIRSVGYVEKKRVPTKPSRNSQKKRMDRKTRHGQTKALRGRVRD